MKKLDKSTVVILAIVSAILSYPTWLLIFIIYFILPNPGEVSLYIFAIIIFIVLTFGCRALFQLYNRTENKRTLLWGQIGFIYLISFTIKFVLDAATFLSGIILTLMIPYGMDIILIIPITIAVNLIIANKQERRPDKRAKTD